jgi:SH3-like domain-containing protein
MTSEVIGMVKQGMNLVIIESNESWSKVHVFEQTGWIASRLLKTEIHAKQ